MKGEDMTEKTIDIDLQIESINSAISELKKHFGEYYELGALVHSIPLLEELKSLRKGRKEFPIATIKFNKEDMQKMVDEKMKEIELDIQKIRSKTIDKFAERLKEKYGCLGYIDEITFEEIDKIAEEMRGVE